jgi:hypothetical protein
MEPYNNRRRAEGYVLRKYPFLSRLQLVFILERRIFEQSKISQGVNVILDNLSHFTVDIIFIMRKWLD